MCSGYCDLSSFANSGSNSNRRRFIRLQQQLLRESDANGSDLRFAQLDSPWWLLGIAGCQILWAHYEFDRDFITGLRGTIRRRPCRAILLLVHVKFLIRRVDKWLHTAFLGSDS